MDEVARNFLSLGIQHWGQTAEKREKATRDYIEAAGFKFGSDEAKKWLFEVCKTLRRGEFNDEVSQLQAALDARK